MGRSDIKYQTHTTLDYGLVRNTKNLVRIRRGDSRITGLMKFIKHDDSPSLCHVSKKHVDNGKKNMVHVEHIGVCVGARARARERWCARVCVWMASLLYASWYQWMGQRACTCIS